VAEQEIVPDLAFDYQTVAEQVRQVRKAKKKSTPDVAALTTAITGIRFEDTIEGSSTLEIEVVDPAYELIEFFEISKSGRIFPLDINYPLDSPAWWRLSQLEVSGGVDGTRFTLTFVERPVAWLTHHYGPIKASRGKMTRAEFFEMLVKKVKVGRGLAFRSYQLHVKQPVEDAGRGGTGGESTSGSSSTGKVGGAHTLLWIGDSLAEGTLPPAEAKLGAKTIDGDAVGGRDSTHGLTVLDGALKTTHNVVIFDLGTNDDILTPGITVANLKTAKQKIKNRRLIVATINFNRPPITGTAVAEFNDAIKRFAAETGGVTLVDWYTSSRPEDLESDGMHCTPAGYEKRANVFTSAVGRTHGGPASHRDARDPDAHHGGVPLNADVKIQGTKAVRRQIELINLCLNVAGELDAPELAVKAMLTGGIGESGFREIMNQGHPPSGYGGVFQGDVTANYRYFKVTDTESQCRHFFQGGKGYQGGGAIALAKAHTDWSPGLIALTVEGSRSNFTSDAAAERHYQQFSDEADRVYELSGGGFLGGGDSGGGTSYYRQQYNFQIGDDANPRQNYWEGMTNLASEVGWRLFCAGRTIYFDSDMTLIRRRPGWIVHREDPAVLSWSARWDDRRIATEMELRAIADPFAYRAGDVFLLEGFGPLSNGSTAEPTPLAGRWLITNISRSSGSLSSTFTLTQPLKPNLEPAGQIGQRAREEQQDDATGANGLGDLSSDMTPQEVIDQLVLPLARKRKMHNCNGQLISVQGTTTCNHGHGQNVAGTTHTSWHKGPPNIAWAVDVFDSKQSQSPDPEKDSLADELFEAFQFPGKKPRDHTYPFPYVSHKGFRFQLGYKTMIGGNHFNHVHFGCHAGENTAPSTASGT
jgi:lysophospholipase L1-like esterase